eukprot:scaffold149_cov383-Prasinococcus_capsulatus_cf.AAC.5
MSAGARPTVANVPDALSIRDQGPRQPIVDRGRAIRSQGRDHQPAIVARQGDRGGEVRLGRPLSWGRPDTAHDRPGQVASRRVRPGSTRSTTTAHGPSTPRPGRVVVAARRRGGAARRRGAHERHTTPHPAARRARTKPPPTHPPAGGAGIAPNQPRELQAARPSPPARGARDARVAGRGAARGRQPRRPPPPADRHHRSSPSIHASIHPSPSTRSLSFAPTPASPGAFPARLRLLLTCPWTHRTGRILVRLAVSLRRPLLRASLVGPRV